MVAEELELGGFLLVAQVHIRFEGRFIAEDLVVVGFVRTDRDVDRRIQVHPRQIAFVIIVRKKRGAARQQKLLESGVGGEPGRFFEQSCRFRQIGLVFLAIRHAGQMPVGVAPYHREKTLGALAIGSRKRLDPALEFPARHVLGIEIRSRQFLRRNIGNKSGVIVQIGPGRLVDPEIMQTRFSERRRVALQLGVESLISAPQLLQENVVQDARGFDQLHQRLVDPAAPAWKCRRVTRWARIARSFSRVAPSPEWFALRPA